MNPITKVQEIFPFSGYMEENIAPYETVERVIQQYLDPGSRIFDFGCGPCDKTAIASAMGHECIAFDDLGDEWHQKDSSRKKIVDFAKSFSIDFQEEFPVKMSGEVDMVMMNDVLEHIRDSPCALLNELISMLRVDGLLFITVPNLVNARKRFDVLRGKTNLPRYDLFYWHSGPWRGPVREYVRDDLEKMVDYLGLELLELSTVHHMLKVLPKAVHTPYQFFTRIFPDLADTWLLVAKKPISWHPALHISVEEYSKIYTAKGKALPT